MKKKRNLYKTATILLIVLLALIAAGTLVKSLIHPKTGEAVFGLVSANPGFYGYVAGVPACGGSNTFNYNSGACEPPYEPWKTQRCQ